MPHSRRGFTMVEFILAGVLLALVLLAMGMSMQQIVKSRNAARARIDAHMRADAALRMMRRDLVSTLRREDLYYTRILLTDGYSQQAALTYDRDEILVFNNRLQATRDIEYNGDGLEFETQYRIEEDDLGPVLWQRRDAMPDAYPRGGGIITPVVEGITDLQIEAWNGLTWFDDWDSDEDGIPWAFRVTVTATGAAAGQAPKDHPFATLRTVVPLDRSRMPLEVADARLADEIVERFGLDPDSWDAVVAAIESGQAPPIPRGGQPQDPDATLDTGGTAAGAAAGAGGPGAGGGAGQRIETPEGTVIIGPDGSSASFEGGPR